MLVKGVISLSLGSKEIMAKNIQFYMDKYGISRNKLCDDLGFKYMTVSDWLKAKTYPRIDKIEMLAHYFGVSKSDLVEDVNVLEFPTTSKDTTLTQITSISATLVDFRQKKVLDYATAQKREQDSKIREDNVTYIYKGRESAAGATILGDDSTLDYEVVSSSMVPRGANELVDITGDSMEPLIMKGSSVYIRHQPTVENGEIAIVRIEDGVTCKRFYHKDGQVILKSENPNYDDIIIESELVHIIGKVLI